MHSKKIKQIFSITLISALLISSAITAFATNVDGANKEKPDHVIEKQQEKQEELTIKREDRIERQNEKREEILKRREEIKERYTEEELEALNENTENMEKQIKEGRVMPFDSIISNRKNIKFDTPPVIKGDRTLVPLRAISEGFKADVEWNNETREVTITKDDKEIVIQIDSNIIFVNGEEIEIDAKAEIMSERTYVPLRFIAETLGIKVEWDQETETIELKEEMEVLKDELQEELDELQEELEELEKKLDDLIEELESLNGENQEELEDEIEEEINNKIKELKELEEEFTSKMDELEEKIEEIQSDLKEVIEEMEQDVEDLEDIEDTNDVEDVEGI